MRAKYAAQLLSETKAKAVKYFEERTILHCKDWGKTNEFTALVDGWFDIFHAKVCYDKNKVEMHMVQIWINKIKY